MAEPYESFIQRMLENFGLHSLAGLGAAAALQRQGDLAVGYTKADSGFSAARLLPRSALIGAGDLVATAGDIAKWDHALFDARFLSASDLKAMATVPALPDDRYGMGMVVGDATPGQRYDWHNGEIPGYHAMNAYFPDDHLAIVLLTNTDALGTGDSVSPESLALEVLGIISPSHPYAIETTYSD